MSSRLDGIKYGLNLSAYRMPKNKGVEGVSYLAGKWIVRVKKRGQLTSLRSFATEKEANDFYKELIKT